MKTKILTICLLSCLALASCDQQVPCDYPVRFIGNYFVDIPADFDGRYERDTYGGKRAVVTAKDCNGPFNLQIISEDGTIEIDKKFSKGELTVDTVYIESPEPPYDLEMHAEKVYKAVEM